MQGRAPAGVDGAPAVGFIHGPASANEVPLRTAQCSVSGARATSQEPWYTFLPCAVA